MDNDIQRHACRFTRQDEDPRDTYPLLIGERIRKLLAQCLGNVLSQSCVAACCSPHHNVALACNRQTRQRGQHKCFELFLFLNAWKT